MRAAKLLLLLSLLVSCGKYPTLLLVQLSGVPADTTSLQVAVALNGAAQPINLGKVVDRFGVYLPLEAKGEVMVTVSTLGGSGCAAWFGESRLDVHGEWEVTVPVVLTERRPALCRVSVQLSDGGEGTVTSPPVNGAAIACSANCTVYVPWGTTLDLSAAAKFPSSFVEWRDACQGSAAACTVSVQGPTRVVASFKKDCALGNEGWCRKSWLKLNRVFATPGGDTWFSGDDGTVLRGKGGWPVAAPITDLTANQYGLGGTFGNDVWMVANGSIYHFVNETWSAEAAPPMVNLRAVWATSNRVWVVGGTNVYQRVGATWTQQGTASGVLTDVWASPEPAGPVWVVGDNGTIMRSPDGVMNFVEMRDGLDASYKPNLKGIWGADRSHLWASGGFENPERGALLSFDGSKWTPVPLSPPPPFLTRIWGAGSDEVWVVGRQSTILHLSQDKWQLIQIPGTVENFSSVFGSSAKDVWVVGDRSMLRRLVQ